MRRAGVIADTRDRQLPPRFFAELHTHLCTQVSADVAEFEQTFTCHCPRRCPVPRKPG
jgi:hypothetical protein